MLGLPQPTNAVSPHPQNTAFAAQILNKAYLPLDDDVDGYGSDENDGVSSVPRKTGIAFPAPFARVPPPTAVPSRPASKQPPKGNGWKHLVELVEQNRVKEIRVSATSQAPDNGMRFFSVTTESNAVTEAPSVMAKTFPPSMAKAAEAEIYTLGIIHDGIDQVLSTMKENRVQQLRMNGETITKDDVKFLQKHMTWPLGHDVSDKGNVLLLLDHFELQFLDAPTLEDAIVKDLLNPEDIFHVVADAFRVLKVLRCMFKGFKHNEFCVRNILIGKGLSGIVSNFMFATTPNGYMRSPFVPHGVSLQAAYDGITDVASASADLHRMWFTLYVSLMRGQLQDPVEGLQAAIIKQTPYETSWKRERVQRIIHDFMPPAYFEPLSLHPTKQTLIGSSQAIANQDARVMTRVTDILRSKPFRDLRDGDARTAFLEGLGVPEVPDLSTPASDVKPAIANPETVIPNKATPTVEKNDEPKAIISPAGAPDREETSKDWEYSQEMPTMAKSSMEWATSPKADEAKEPEDLFARSSSPSPKNEHVPVTAAEIPDWMKEENFSVSPNSGALSSSSNTKAQRAQTDTLHSILRSTPSTSQSQDIPPARMPEWLKELNDTYENEWEKQNDEDSDADST